jgi:hypothetical protein
MVFTKPHVCAPKVSVKTFAISLPDTALLKMSLILTNNAFPTAYRRSALTPNMESYPADRLQEDLSKKRVSAPIPPPRLSSKSFSVDRSESKTEKTSSSPTEGSPPKMSITIPKDGKKKTRSPLDAFYDLRRRASRSPIRERLGFGSSSNRRQVARTSRFVEIFDFESPLDGESADETGHGYDEKAQSEQEMRARDVDVSGKDDGGETIKMAN